ncbi:MAG: cupin domain-containing protein [Armatimonadota bacterium]|nr:cupin domain-containing protein [Armatimonadota bacterium]
MKLVHAAAASGFFRLVGGTPRSQAATMVLAPGQGTGGADNVHDTSDQWLYVIAGRGEAVVRGRRVALAAGTLLLIEAGEPHEIRNTGRTPLVTVNVYAPPVY